MTNAEQQSAGKTPLKNMVQVALEMGFFNRNLEQDLANLKFAPLDPNAKQTPLDKQIMDVLKGCI